MAATYVYDGTDLVTVHDESVELVVALSWPWDHRPDAAGDPGFRATRTCAAQGVATCEPPVLRLSAVT
jgi:hypothetical protein